MKKLGRDEILVALAILLLFFTAMITWNIYSWFVLVAVILMIIAWYFRK